MGPAVYWVVALLFGMMIALRQSSADSAELRDLQRLLAVDPAARLVGKALAGAVWLLGLLLVLGAATVVLYAPAVPVRWWMMPIVLMLVALGVAMAATLAGEVAAGLRSRSTLAPLLAAPLGVPVLVAAAETTDRLQVGGSILTPTLLLVLVDLILAIVIVLAAGPLEDATRDPNRIRHYHHRAGHAACLEPLALLALLAGLWFAMTAPPDATQGDFYRILYIHVPSAWLAFLAFGVTAVGSIGYLIRRRRSWDRVAAASASVGVVFTALTLVTGSIWGRPVWGVWWDFGDARLMSTAIMFFVYLGYLALRRTVEDPEDASPPLGGAGRGCGHPGAVGVLLGQPLPDAPPDADDPPRWRRHGARDAVGAVGQRRRLHRALRRAARPPHRGGPAGGDRRGADPGRAGRARRCSRHLSGRLAVGDGWVVFCYTVTYGMIAWYAVWLMTRYRGLRHRLRQGPTAICHRRPSEPADPSPLPRPGDSRGGGTGGGSRLAGSG